VRMSTSVKYSGGCLMAEDLLRMSTSVADSGGYLMAEILSDTGNCVNEEQCLRKEQCSVLCYYASIMLPNGYRKAKINLRIQKQDLQITSHRLQSLDYEI
jgi:hypothetical protein